MTHSHRIGRASAEHKPGVPRSDTAQQELLFRLPVAYAAGDTDINAVLEEARRFQQKLWELCDARFLAEIGNIMDEQGDVLWLRIQSEYHEDGGRKILGGQIKWTDGCELLYCAREDAIVTRLNDLYVDLELSPALAREIDDALVLFWYDDRLLPHSARARSASVREDLLGRGRQSPQPR